MSTPRAKKPSRTKSAKKSPRSSAPKADAANGGGDDDVPTDSPALASALEARKLFIYGGFGKKPTGGAQLWHSVVDLRKAYDYTPWVHKGEIEGYQGCNYYHPEMLTLTSSGGGKQVWRQPSINSSDPNDNAYVPAGRTGHTCTSIGNGKFLVYGGCNEQVASGKGKKAKSAVQGDIEILDTRTGVWTTAPPGGKPPSSRTGHTACLVNHEHLVIIGGTDNGKKFFKAPVVLNVATMTWTTPQVSGDGPGPIAYHSAHVVGTQIYVFGGTVPARNSSGKMKMDSDGLPILTSTGKMYILDCTDIAAPVWTKAVVNGTPPGSRTRHASCVMFDDIYVFGGQMLKGDSEKLQGDLYKFNVPSLTWSLVDAGGRKPVKRDDACMVACGETHLLVYGGWTGRWDKADKSVSPWTSTMHVLDLESMQWTKIPSSSQSPPPRYGHTMTLIDYGGAFPANCYASGVEDGVAGVESVFMIQAMDEHNKPRASGNDEFVIEIGGADQLSAVCTDLKNGTYEVRFTPTVAGEYVMDILLREEEIGDNPYSFVIEPAATDPTQCQADGEGLENGEITGSPRVFNVYTRDEFGNVTDPDPALVSVTIQGPANRHATVEASDRPGIIHVSYDTTVSGAYSAAVLFDGQPVDGSPFHYDLVPGPMSSCELSGSGASSGVAGLTSTFHILPKDQFGNSKSAAGLDLLAELRGPETIAIDTQVDTSGNVACAYGATKAGIYRLHLSVAGQPIAGSEREIEVLAGSPSPADSQLSGDGCGSAVAGEPTTITLKTFDKYGNPLTAGGNNVSMTLSGGGDVAADSIVDNRDGTYTITYTPTVTGDAVIQVKVDGTQLSAQPTVNIKAGTFSASKSSVEGPGLKKCVAGTAGVFAIYLRDSANNIITATPDMVTVSITGEQGDTSGVTVEPKVTSGDDGQLAVSYQASTAGAYKIEVGKDGSSIGASPFSMKCQPGECDASKCQITGAGASSATAGQDTEFTIQTFDAFGNPRAVGNDTVKVALVDADGKEIPVTAVSDNGDGTYTVTYKPKKVGSLQCVVKIGGKEVPNTQAITVTAGGAAGINCTADGAGLKEVTVGIAAPFTITTADEFGNRRTTGGDSVVVQVTPPGGEKPLVPHVEDKGDGTYAVSWTAHKVGDHEITVLVGGISIKYAPFTSKAIPGAPDASKSSMQLDSSGPCEAGVTQTATVKVCDAFKNQVSNGGHKIVATVAGTDGKNQVAVDIKDNGDGTYTLSYTPTIVGEYKVNVSLDNADIGDGNGSKFSTTCTRVSAAHCKASGPGLEGCTAGDRTSFTIECFDCHGNRVDSGGDNVVLALQGGPVASNDVKDNGDGTYTASYHVTKAAEYSIDVKVGGESIKDAPFKVQAESGGIDSACSSYTGDHLTECIVGEELTATIRCNDGSNNPTASDTLPTLKLSGPEHVSATVTEVSTGVYEARYVVRRAGFYDIEVKAGHTAIGKPTVLTAKADKVDPSRTTAYGAGLTGALSGFNASFVIEARDRFGNLCPSADKSLFVAQFTGPETLTAAIAPGPDAGTFLATYNATKVGKYKCQVGADGVQIERSPFEVHVVPEDDVIGVDFGTSFCSVGVYSAGGYQVLDTIPSAIAFTEKEGAVFGARALEIQREHPDAVVFDMKRMLGQGYDKEQVQEDIKNVGWKHEAGPDGNVMYVVRTKHGEMKKYTCEALVGLLIAHLKDYAQKEVKLKELKHCAITVPAMYEDAQRSGIRDAVTLAGLNLIRILNESTAAAVAYYKQIGEDAPPRKVLVFDLGGGTFDVSAISTKDQMVSVGASSGSSHLGGEDFDIVLAQHILSAFPDEGSTKGVASDPLVIQRARRVAEKAKIELAKETETVVDLGEIVKGNGNTITLTRDVFDQLNMHYFDYIVALCEQVVAEAQLQPADIDEIVMVGGSTYLPTLRKKVCDFFGGKTPVELIEKDPIAIGVAVQAGVIGGRDKKTKIRTADVATNSLGIEVAGGQMAPIIPRNSKLPITNQMEFATSEDDQEEIELNVYQGEEEMAADCTLLGQYTLQDIPKAPVGTPILVTFRVDESGVLSIEAESSGVKMSVEVEKKAKVDRVEEEYSDEEV